MSLNPEAPSTPSHRFRFIPGQLMRKQPNHHSRKLLDKLQKMLSQSRLCRTTRTTLSDVKLKIFAEGLHKPGHSHALRGQRVGYLVDSIKPFLGDSKDSFVFKVTGLDEYLSNETVLSDYEYICACSRLGKTAWLTLLSLNTVHRPWTAEPRAKSATWTLSEAGDSGSEKCIGFEDVKERIVNFENRRGPLGR
ncbi:hypothetical protein HPB48_017830 [Haemaphysalis longicornis]|uniref:PI3K-RBD domain-containing protein n=1 Tax=Haemaphysalis longicornis TaxID=44386 RepID=A0A9J6GAK6_HAELO|nr:hypothetical protein HPB48_017830 [Haemaphysalis longicornis]